MKDGFTISTAWPDRVVDERQSLRNLHKESPYETFCYWLMVLAVELTVFPYCQIAQGVVLEECDTKLGITRCHACECVNNPVAIWQQGENAHLKRLWIVRRIPLNPEDFLDDKLGPRAVVLVSQ